MSKSVSASLNAGRSLTSRAVHVVVEPQPRTLHESRQVLRVLKDFGDITMFRSLRHDPLKLAPNSILAVYQTTDGASKLLAASPLRFTADPPQARPLVTSVASFGISHIFTDDIRQRAEDPDHELEQESPQAYLATAESTPREFHLSVDKSFADHQSHIIRQEYYWGFVRNNKSSAHDHLIKSVPLEGLATISVKPVPLNNRLVKKNLNEVEGRKTLRQLWEDGRQDRSPKITMEETQQSHSQQL